jgi:hypothetical protein
MTVRRSRRQGLLVLLFSIATAFLASGCLWGMVTDAETGAPVGGATISYADSAGQTGTTTTDANGMYSFDGSDEPVPAAGPVNFVVDAPGYEPATETRQVGLGGVQNFSIAPTPVLYHNEDGGYSIALPNGWEIRDNFWGTGTVMAVPPTGSPDYPGDISVGGGTLPSGTTLEDWREDTIGNVCSMSADCEAVESGETTIDGLRALWVVVSYTTTSEHELYTVGQHLQELAYFFKKGSTGYIIDLTATAENFSRLRSQYEQVAQSFEFD